MYLGVPLRVGLSAHMPAGLSHGPVSATIPYANCSFYLDLWAINTVI